MKARVLKFAIGGALILAGLGGLVAWAASRPGAVAFFVTPSELAQDAASLQGRAVRVSAPIDPATVRHEGDEYRFTLDGGDVRIPVTYHGTVPQTFKSTYQVKGWEVVVEGRVRPGPAIDASHVLIRHPPEMTAAP